MAYFAKPTGENREYSIILGIAAIIAGHQNPHLPRIKIAQLPDKRGHWTLCFLTILNHSSVVIKLERSFLLFPEIASC